MQNVLKSALVIQNEYYSTAKKKNFNAAFVLAKRLQGAEESLQKKLIIDDAKLLRLIFNIFTTKFNWSYYDGYSEDNVAQLGFGFSLILLSKYGNQKRVHGFYAKKYFKAFPQLVENAIPPNYGTIEEELERCYLLRTFERFLKYFGLINIEHPTKILGNSKIIKTDLYDKLIKCKLPNYT